MEKYYIIEVAVPGGTRSLEKALAGLAREYVDCVMSEASLQALVQKLEAKQARLIEMNRRLKPVTVKLELNKDIRYIFPYISIGTVQVHIRRVKAEHLE